MIINQVKHETFTNSTKKTAFQIQRSGKVAKMVISGMYSSKESSITREIWSNAFDAHAMVGKADVPFSVQLPTPLRSEFIVRDYGPGLSDQFMNEFYTIIGYSSKEETNDAVGKWGVGRLSPLSYVDSFTVTSYYKGYKTVYNVSWDMQGDIDLSTLVPATKTDEPSGLKVSFPVRSGDIQRFYEAAKTISRGFDVKPVTMDNTKIEWPETEVRLKGEGYTIYKADSSFSKSKVQMGCVIYPIDLTYIHNYAAKTFLSQNSVILHVPVGSMEVTTSREDLSYGDNEPTIETLNNCAKKVFRNFKQDIKVAFDNATNEYEQYEVYLNSPEKTFMKEFVGISGQEIHKGFTVGNEWLLGKKDYYKVNLSLTYGGMNTDRQDGVFFFYKNGPDHYFGFRESFRNFLKNYPKNTKYIAIPVTWDTDKKEYNYDEYNLATKVFGKEPLAATDYVPSTYVKTKRAGTVNLKDINCDNFQGSFEDGGYYILKERGNYPDFYCYSHRAVVAMLKVIGIKTNEVIDLPKSRSKKFVESEDWVNIADVILSKIKEDGQKIYDVKNQPSYTEEFNLLSRKDQINCDLFHRYFKYFDVSGADYHGITKYFCSEILSLFRLNINFKPVEDNTKVIKSYKDLILDKYPMLKYVGYNRNGKDVIDYINFVYEHTK